MNMISNNEFLQSVLESAAWKKISESETLSMEILEKYQDKLDWDEISENGNILWTVDGVKKFSRRINGLSSHIAAPTLLFAKQPSVSSATSGTGRGFLTVTLFTTIGLFLTSLPIISTGLP